MGEAVSAPASQVVNHDVAFAALRTPGRLGNGSATDGIDPAGIDLQANVAELVEVGEAPELDVLAGVSHVVEHVERGFQPQRRERGLSGWSSRIGASPYCWRPSRA